MKKYFVIFALALTVLVGGCGLALANSTTQYDLAAEEADVAATEETMIADWLATIEAAELAVFYGPESVLDDDADIVTTVDEATDVYEEYEAGLDEIFTEREKADCVDLYGNYPEEVDMRDEIIADSNQQLLEFVGYGFFDIEMLDYTIDGDTAVMNVLVTKWSKSIDQCGDSGFDVVFPVNKSIRKVQMLFEDGAWKYDKWDVASDILMEGDYDLEQTFPTYEEAVAYANSVTPRNVLADEVVEINAAEK